MHRRRPIGSASTEANMEGRPITDEQFEALSKALASEVSRRQAIKTVAATGAGAVLAAFGIGSEGRTARREPGSACRSGADCSTGVCDPATGRCIWL
jgi:hypothetical protein